ncbi:transcription antitermination factor NusB [uncultured Amnibacterium sp.]|uniref:transcription antitermination factor NusB n=1 Tax=uncultured Amnibacterium sp. TaxID=1631851 RepID=UPI0035C96013
MSARSKARKRALDVLFAADVRGDSIEAALAAEGARALDAPQRSSSWPYAREIVQGVLDHRAEIDDLIARSSTGWPLDRMPAVDRAILRIAVWEITYNDEVPTPVAIDEAVQHAKELSTDDSPRFVNGVLDGVTRALSA